LEHIGTPKKKKTKNKKNPHTLSPKRKKNWTSHECMLSLLIGKGTKLWDIVGAFRPSVVGV
jgi:hypothetical protein